MKSNREPVLFMLADMSISAVNMHSYMYLLQHSGIDFGLHFSLTSRGVKSKQLKNLIDELDSKGYFDIDRQVNLTSLGEVEFDNLLISEVEAVKFTRCVNLLSTLTVEEVDLVTTTDVIMQDKISQSGVSALATQKNSIIKIVEGFKYTTYSEETFDKIFKVLQILRFS